MHYLVPAMKRKGPGTGTQAVWVGSDGQVKGKDTLNEPLAWSAALPNLIKWSYFVDELDGAYCHRCIYSMRASDANRYRDSSR